MNTFTIRKDIRANGRRWDEIIGSTYSPVNLFYKKDIRDAWNAMENDFCVDTVNGMLSAIDKYCDDTDELVEVFSVHEFTVTVRFSNKRTTLMHPEFVEYTLYGDLREPKEYPLQ